MQLCYSSHQIQCKSFEPMGYKLVNTEYIMTEIRTTNCTNCIYFLYKTQTGDPSIVSTLNYFCIMESASLSLNLESRKNTSWKDCLVEKPLIEKCLLHILYFSNTSYENKSTTLRAKFISTRNSVSF